MTIFNYSFSKKYEKRQINKKLWFREKMILLCVEMTMFYFVAEYVLIPEIERIIGWMLFYGGLTAW